MSRVLMEGFGCSRCGHVWVPRTDDWVERDDVYRPRADTLPKLCPRCKSPLWNEPKETRPAAKVTKKPWDKD